MSIQTTHTLIFMCGYVLIIIFIHSLTSTNAYNYYNVVSASAWFSLKFFSFFPSSSISIFPTGFCSVGGGVNNSIPMKWTYFGFQAAKLNLRELALKPLIGDNNTLKFWHLGESLTKATNCIVSPKLKKFPRKA